MLPIPATHSSHIKGPETLGLLPLVEVTPIASSNEEQAAWAKLKSGVKYKAQIVEQQPAQQTAKASANVVNSRVQLLTQDGEAMQMWMALPAGLAGKAIEMQFAGKPNQAHVKWQGSAHANTAQANSNIAQTAGMMLHLENDLASSATHVGQATSLQLSDAGKSLHVWRESAYFANQTPMYEAKHVVSHQPERPQVLAQDLKYALNTSGLFYESHLKKAGLGIQSWHSLMQEPQNQAHFSPSGMVAQQLQVLEQQRFIWHGEVWPGQTMKWQVIDADQFKQSQSTEVSVKALQSTLVLNLPNLGEVKVQLGLIDGHVQVHLEAAESATLAKMQAEKAALSLNMKQAGLNVAGLSMQSGADDGH